MALETIYTFHHAAARKALSQNLSTNVLHLNHEMTDVLQTTLDHETLATMRTKVTPQIGLAKDRAKLPLHVRMNLHMRLIAK
jgi:hypothetical protein